MSDTSCTTVHANKNPNSDDSTNIRMKVFQTLKEQVPQLSELSALKVEKSVFAWTLEYADKRNIVKMWLDKRFVNVYVNKVNQLLTVFMKCSYVYKQALNGITGGDHDTSFSDPDYDNLMRKIEEGTLDVDRIAYYQPHELLPDKWNEYVDNKNKKDDSVCNTKQLAKTDMFKCSKCKKRECSYYELQVRSADESMTVFITCLNCGHMWRIG